MQALKLGSVVVLCAALFFSGAALADDQPTPPAQAGQQNQTPAPPGSMDEVICLTQSEPITGTRITRKRQVCKTRREWLEDKKNAEAFLKKVQEGGATSNPKSGG